MKDRGQILGILILFILIIFVLYTAFSKNPKNISPEKAAILSLKELSAEDLLKQMTLEEKVGQMMMVGFWGKQPDYYIKKMMKERNIGGVILMKYNIETRDQLMQLTQSLQASSTETNPAIPLFIAVDQEGGDVLRVKVDGVSEFTPQAEIKNEIEALEVGAKRGNELKSLGININLSPVVDYLTDKEAFLWPRTFQKNLKQSGALAEAMIQGYQNSIIAAPKHFLGHPDTALDPHKTEIHAPFSSKELMERVNLFKEILEKASPEMVMSSHVTYDQIDSKTPCSLSKACITTWLKEKSGFDSKLVLTDDMEKGAIQSHYKNAEAAIKAIQAGNDILLYVTEPEAQVEAYNSIVDAVKKGEIDEKQIDNSVLKILELKKQYLMN